MPIIVQHILRSRWPWLAASLGLTITLFVATTIGWLWYADQRAAAARQSSLDLLWLEQMLGQRLEANQKMLSDWAHDLAAPSDQATADFLALTDGLMKQNPALISVDYLDKQGRRVAGLPAYNERGRPGRLPPINDPLVTEAIRRSLAQRTPVYSRVIEPYAPLWVLAIPVSEESGNGDTVVATYDLDELLSREVPWWFVQRYDLSLVDRDDKRLYPQDGGTPPDAAGMHKLEFGPVDSGLSLRASPHVHHPNREILLGLLALAVVLLALLIVWLLRVLQRWLLERHAAQQALSKELHFREAMERSLVTGLLAFDGNGRIIYANPALCGMLGLPVEALIGAVAPFAFWPAEHIDACIDAHEAMLRGENPASGRVLTLRCADGSSLSARLFASPLVDDSGNDGGAPGGWMVSLYDMTAELRAANAARERDDLLQHTARLATLAEFASGIAHELNQPLAAIANYSAAAGSFLEQGPAQTHKAREAVHRMGEESRRAGQIIHSLRSFIQRRQVRHERHDLARLLEEPLALLEPLMQRAQVKVSIDTGERPALVECDAVMIEQVLFNLIRNAVEAVASLPARAPREAVEVGFGHDGEAVTVTVSDRGPGITDFDKLFQAFYTTKSEGMGLGLAICRTVIEGHGGRLWAEPNDDGGARFRFRLPCTVAP